MEKPHCEPLTPCPPPWLALRNRMIRLAVSLAMMTVLTACTPPSTLQPQTAQTAAGADPDPWIQQAAFDTATGDARMYRDKTRRKGLTDSLTAPATVTDADIRRAAAGIL